MSVTQRSYERFLANVGIRAGLGETDESESAARAVIAVLMKLLPAPLRHDLETALPDALLSAGSTTPLQWPCQVQDAFFHAVANTEHVPVGFAKEHVVVVCQALVDLLPAELLQRIRLAVGEDLAIMFRHREHLPRPQKETRDTRRTISAGRPGGLRPLSEAAPSDDENNIARGRPGGRRPLSEAHPGQPDERLK